MEWRTAARWRWSAEALALGVKLDALAHDVVGGPARVVRQRPQLGRLRPPTRVLRGAARHVGRSPNSDEAAILRRKRLDELQQELASAIRDEAYEQAAKLRDEIKSLERA